MLSFGVFPNFNFMRRRKHPPLCGEIVNILAFLQKITDVSIVSDSLGHVKRIHLYKAMVTLRFGQVFRPLAAEHLDFPKILEVGTESLTLTSTL